MKRKVLAAISILLLLFITTVVAIGAATILVAVQYPHLSKEAMK